MMTLENFNMNWKERKSEVWCLSPRSFDAGRTEYLKPHHRFAVEAMSNIDKGDDFSVKYSDSYVLCT